MKRWNAGAAAAILALTLACTAVGYFLGRATVSPGMAAVVVTERGAPEQETALISPKETKTAERTAEPLSEAAEETNPVDFKAASREELESLPGIGPKLAERIVSYREENGPFTTAEELCEVSGIGEKLLEKIRAQIVVGG